MTNQSQQTHIDLELFLEILPATIREPIMNTGHADELVEVVMDLGRQPSARFADREEFLRDAEVLQSEIDQVVAGTGQIDDDNRAGIARTLHRISAIRNRRGDVVGLTCRIGRAVYGTIDIIADLIEEERSVLLLGRPGVGKTTMLREMARILAEDKRVVIVDTSNEIGGDGDIPHPAVGRARRMQVPRPSYQHETMIEAVENHNPEVIIIDEIGREREAAAARTINERGVQLIGTAHGRTLENLLLNPTLSDLVGGIESVTLSDDEARRRGTQKTVLERRAPATFDILIEIQERQRLLVHRDVTASVDAMLRGRAAQVELRYRDEAGQIHVEQQEVMTNTPSVTGRRADLPDLVDQPLRSARGRRSADNGKSNGNSVQHVMEIGSAEPQKKRAAVFAYGVARNRLLDAAKNLGIHLEIVDQLDDADYLVTLKSFYRKRRRLIMDAEQNQIPVYVLRANTVNQMESFLAQALGLEATPIDPFERAINEAGEAIRRVQSGEQTVNLRPVGTAMRRYQHQMARQADLTSHSYGREPNRYVRIFSIPPGSN
ncbi:MAG: AAA family ATPase [Anaerolineae bacterium]|nr:AAA family ATPase [Anaerolineae bacterium]MCO5188913.1 AAA family ATPase [Anaerolineae bacterium]MCO5193281.1 AAA family ATPase [Anaerolineae bacterium]MCO5196162.1 AAA family ATPase [Anaerolineae bacterium]MCO5207054.1 AAA family ATPase [Anaerolineae bacterium]